MKIGRDLGTVRIELSMAEARVLLDELVGVRGGARLPKLRQVCRELEALFSLMRFGEKRQKDMRPRKLRVVLNDDDRTIVEEKEPQP